MAGYADGNTPFCWYQKAGLHIGCDTPVRLSSLRNEAEVEDCAIAVHDFGRYNNNQEACRADHQKSHHWILRVEA